MSVTAVDELTNDTYLRGGSLARLEAGAEIAQKCATKLQLFQGEWWLNVLAGIPWRQRILGEPHTLGETEAILKGAILSIEGVTGLDEFFADFDKVTRDYTFRFRAATIYGPTGEITI